MVRRLGAGGMAEVFEAVMLTGHGFERRVAIKRIFEAVAAQPGSVQQFLDEARIASQLHHAGIVAVLDYGLLDDRPFQVLEFVDGLNGAELLARARRTLPVDIGLALVADVAHALDHAHRASGTNGPLGIVHRDVKPANVLISWDGDIKLSDFGIAWAHGRGAQTEAGVARGTTSYMAPEQRAAGHVDARTDVYALGVTLHVFLTGTSPLAKPAAIQASLLGQPPQLAPELPADVRALLERACAPRPADRFPDAASMANALGPLLAVRLQRDVRGRLREYLASLRAPTPRAGLLDQLLAVEMVFDPPSEATRPLQRDRTKRYHLQPTALAAANRPPGEPPALPDVAPAPLAKPAVRRAPRWRWLAVTALGLAGVVVVVSVRAGEPASIVEQEGAAPSVSEAVGRVELAAAPTDAAAADALEVIVDSGHDSGAVDALSGRVRLRDAGHPLDRATPSAAPSPTILADGWFQIVGADVARAQIVVDGKVRGFAPNPIRIPVGAHRVQLILDDGRTLPSFTIDVTAYHTRTRPLRVSK